MSHSSSGAFYFLLRELVQLMSLIGLGLGLGSWFTDTDNWIDVILIASTLFFGLIMFDNQIVDISPQGFRAGCALTKGFLWVALIFFLKSARINFAVFLDGLVYVVKQLLAFVMAALSILIGFALMFYIYYNQRDICTTVTPEDCRPFPHCSLSFSLLKVSPIFWSSPRHYISFRIVSHLFQFLGVHNDDGRNWIRV